MIDDEAQDWSIRLSVDDEQSKIAIQIQVIMSCISRWAVYSHDSSYIYNNKQRKHFIFWHATLMIEFES